jgi:chromosome segregation ATPase
MISKDNNDFTKSIIESNEIFKEAVQLLQGEINKVNIRLEGLETKLKNAREQLKSKDFEILRLTEIIKTYESEQSSLATRINPQTIHQLVTNMEKLSNVLTVSNIPVGDKSENKSINDSQIAEFEQLQKNYKLEKEEKIQLQIKNKNLEDQIKELKNSTALEEEHINSLKREVGTYIKENISLQEQINNTETLEKKIASQKEEIEKLSQNYANLSQEKAQFEEKVSEYFIIVNEQQRRQHEFETKYEQALKKHQEYVNEINYLKRSLAEKEEELLNVKIQENQLQDDNDDELSIESLNSKNYRNSTDIIMEENELLLKISEMEMEEANWQNEKKAMLLTLQNMKEALKNPNDVNFHLETQKKDNLIQTLKNEITELGQDIDNADEELKELELENSVLREKITELEGQTSINNSELRAKLTTTTEIDESTNLAYELKQNEEKLEEYEKRLQTQEQKILHLENLLDQERQLKEKNEFLYKNLKNKVEKKEIENSSAKKQLEQVLQSLNKIDPVYEVKNDETEDPSVKETKADQLSNALDNAQVYMSLVDKFLKPHVQVTQLLKQGDWEINSLSDIVGIKRDELKKILHELAGKKILAFDDHKVWLVGKKEAN